jgi:ATP-dependent DNA helicase PIF1
MRRSNLPFGGLQLVLTGDFCQLEGVNGDYCFKSEIWSTLNLRTVYLHKQIRQDGDLEFQNMLSKLRYGKCTNKIYEKLSALKNTEFNEIQPTRLYPRNVDVDRINKQEYDKLIKSGAKILVYNIEFPKLSKNKEKTLKWIKTLDIPESIELCVGAQIVILANIDQDQGIVNGTRGVIIDLKPYCVIIKRIDGSVVEIKYHKTVSSEDKDIFVNFMPMKLAYALSIHKAQGMTLDAIEIDIGTKIFAAGQAYTALSRAKNLKSIKIKDISMNSFIVNDDVLQFYKDIEKKIKIKNEKYINKILNILIYNIANHVNLDNSLEFVWEFIDSEDEDTLAFFDGYNTKKITLKMDDYIENNTYDLPLIDNIKNIKKMMSNSIDTVYEKLNTYDILQSD